MPVASSLWAPSTRRGASRRGPSGSVDAVGACVDHGGCARGQRRRRNRGRAGALAAAAARGWTLRASAGTQYQLPPLAALHGLLGNPALRMPHAFGIDGGVEHAVGGGQTLTVDVYRRRDRDGLFALAEPRVEHGRAIARLNPVSELARRHVARRRGGDSPRQRPPSQRMGGIRLRERAHDRRRRRSRLSER